MGSAMVRTMMLATVIAVIASASAITAATRAIVAQEHFAFRAV